jgi:hypothetical protein
MPLTGNTAIGGGQRKTLVNLGNMGDSLNISVQDLCDLAFVFAKHDRPGPTFLTPRAVSTHAELVIMALSPGTRSITQRFIGPTISIR